MALSLVLTFVGPDRPGIVEAISSLVAAHGGNWLESRMTRLGGQFAGVARVWIPPGRESGLRLALDQLSGCGLSVEVASDATHASASSDHSVRARLEVVGQDRPGIVSEISRCLAARGVNVEEFSSFVESAAMAGGLLFRCRADLVLPASLSVGELRSALEQIATDLMVDLHIVTES
jgi:glycine cleavage system regulatory protein